jgi:hypothetical protein
MINQNLINFINNHAGLWAFIPVAIIILTALGYLYRKHLKQRLARLIGTKGIELPKETMRIVPQANELFWNYGTMRKGQEEKKIILVSCKFFLTNITKGHIIVTDSYMTKPPSNHARPMIVEDFHAFFAGNSPILPRATAELECTYRVEDITGHERGKPIVCDVVIVDQLTNKHTVKRLETQFRGR